MTMKLLAAGMILGCLGAWLRQEYAQQVRAGGDVQPKKLTKLYFGVSLCRKCHNEKSAVPDKDALLYRGTEMSTWDQFDKHKDATRVLQGERSQRMATNLGWKDVAHDQRCLSCHGVVVANEKEAHEGSFQPAQREESGVSCVVCHGAYREWVDNHATVTGGDAWKKLTRIEKERDQGLRDLWDPAKRAALCCSCHIGNAVENKVVTHEMYAAGHPPLPSFELNSFSEAMPRHWETLSEKVARTRNKEFYKRVHGFLADPDDNDQVRMLAVSGAVAFRSTIQLTHDLAQREAKTPNAKEPAWPELAAFDCYACHHELKSESWRQLRVSSGRPGRPALRQWPMALLSVAFPDTATPNNDMLSVDFTRKMRDLQAALDKTPFGDPKTVAEKAEALVQWSKNQEQAAQAARYDRGATQRMLQTLFHRSGTELLDFDSARQLAWALQTLLPAANAKAAQQDRAKKHLGSLSAQLRLELPKGQKRIAEDFLPEVLKSMSAYDPREFQKTAQALAAELFPASK